MKDVIGSLTQAAHAGDADAWKTYRALLAGGQGSDADKAALQSAMKTLGLSADDVHQHYNTMHEAIGLADGSAKAQAAVAAAATGLESLDAFISDAEAALAERDRETERLIAAYRAGRRRSVRRSLAPTT